MSGPEWTNYRDSLTGVEVVELTSTGEADNLYYHFPNFTADGKRLVFAADRGAGWQIYSLEVATGRIRQLTEGEGVSARSACPHPANPSKLSYLRGSRMMELNLESRKERTIGEFPEPKVGGSA